MPACKDNFEISIILKLNFSDLRKDFETPPYSTHIEVGSQAELRCHPPKGHPPAQVTSWLRNGVPIETKTDSNFIVSSTGHLLILQATLSDTANYSCVAANVARQRTSEAALVTIYSKYFKEIFEVFFKNLENIKLISVRLSKANRTLQF